jgi:hypothetical protein
MPLDLLTPSHEFTNFTLQILQVKLDYQTGGKMVGLTVEGAVAES